MMTRSQHAPTDTTGFSDNVIGGLYKVAEDTHEKWIADFMGSAIKTKQTDKPARDSQGGSDCPPDSSQGDVRFRYLTDSQVTDLTKSENFNDARDAYKELIDRADSFEPKQFDDIIRGIDARSKALKLGRDIVKNEDGTYGIDFSKPLSEEKRWLIHSAITMDVQRVTKQIEKRMDFAKFMSENRHFDEAFDLSHQAINRAERLLQPVDIGGKQVTLLDLFDEEARQLIVDQNEITDPSKRVSMQKWSLYLKGRDANSGIMHLPERALNNLLEVYKRNHEFSKMPARNY